MINAKFVWGKWSKVTKRAIDRQVESEKKNYTGKKINDERHKKSRNQVVSKNQQLFFL